MKIAVLTSGGDAPGMNAAVRSVTRCALYRGWEVWGVAEGYRGLIAGELRPLVSRDVGGIIDRGGTFLGTSRCPEFREAAGRRRALEVLADHAIGGLVVIGGNGSLAGAHDLSAESGLQLIGLPASIDNDLAGTDNSIGFDTAVNTALDAVDKLRQTADSHHRIFVVEVMGRDCGALAVEVALAGGAEAALVPEAGGLGDLEELAAKLIRNLKMARKKSAVVILAEGAGEAPALAERLARLTGLECRATVLGHLQRGGAPTSYDRNLASRLGAVAVEQLAAGTDDVMVGLVAAELTVTPLADVLAYEHAFNRQEFDLVGILSH
ncbi:MAG: 6-phosphofructokinase [Candidatus Coatesbacteria bacterium]|nr:6-phosphofructokinase [Candidatus Coatesbacteria bacterium]